MMETSPIRRCGVFMHASEYVIINSGLEARSDTIAAAVSRVRQMATRSRAQPVAALRVRVFPDISAFVGHVGQLRETYRESHSRRGRSHIMRFWKRITRRCREHRVYAHALCTGALSPPRFERFCFFKLPLFHSHLWKSMTESGRAEHHRSCNDGTIWWIIRGESETAKFSCARELINDL